jgi:hypothetical protein
MSVIMSIDNRKTESVKNFKSRKKCRNFGCLRNILNSLKPEIRQKKKVVIILITQSKDISEILSECQIFAAPNL